MSHHDMNSPDEVDRLFHDMNNTLGAIVMNLDILRERSEDGSHERIAADAAMGQAQKLEAQMKDLKVTLKSPPPRRTI